MNSAFILILVVMTSFSIPLRGEECLPAPTKNKGEEKSCSSLDHPIVFEGVRNIEKVRALEDEYLQKNYPDHDIVLTGLSQNKNGRSIMTIKLEKDGKMIDVFFDEEEASIEYGKKNAKDIERTVDKILKKQKKDNNEEDLPGTSFSKAILLKNAKTDQDVDQQEKDFLKKYYPDYQIVGKEIWFVEKKFLDRVKVKKGHEQETVNFDISPYIREYKKKKQLKFKELYPTAYLVEIPSSSTND